MPSRLAPRPFGSQVFPSRNLHETATEHSSNRDTLFTLQATSVDDFLHNESISPVLQQIRHNLVYTIAIIPSSIVSSVDNPPPLHSSTSNLQSSNSCFCHSIPPHHQHVFDRAHEQTATFAEQRSRRLTDIQDDRKSSPRPAGGG